MSGEFNTSCGGSESADSTHRCGAGGGCTVSRLDPRRGGQRTRVLTRLLASHPIVKGRRDGSLVRRFGRGLLFDVEHLVVGMSPGPFTGGYRRRMDPLQSL
jgi:hypothetical protein